MAKKSTQAAESGLINTPAAAAVRKMIAGAAKAAEADFANAKNYSVEVREKAFAAALDCISGVRGGQNRINSLNTEIETVKSGNGQKLHNLAIECVKLTLSEDGKVANLKAAAELMGIACDFAEKQTLHAVTKENGGNAPKHIRNVVPSWPVLKANVINAMKKAAIDPREYPQPSGVRTAYEEWKKANPAEVDNRGANPGGTLPAATPPATAGHMAAGASSVVDKFTAGARSAVNTLIVAVQGLSPEKQNEAAELIAACVMEINALKSDATEEEMSTQNSDDAPQTRMAPIPARVPESNQMAA